MISGMLIAAAALAVLMLVALARALLGPTTADRLVALDTTNTLGVAALVLLGAAWGEAIFIDVAIVYAMLAFISTLFVSRYLEGSL